MIAVIILSLLCIVLSVALGWTISKLFTYGKLILEVQDALEEGLDVIEASFVSVNAILEIPVMMDSVEIRHVIEQLKNVSGALQYVANVAAAPFGGVVEEDATPEEQDA